MPSPFVVAFFCAPLASVKVTFAPTITAPSSSVIDPRNVPRVCWAVTSAAVRMKNRAIRTRLGGRLLTEFIGSPFGGKGHPQTTDYLTWGWCELWQADAE